MNYTLKIIKQGSGALGDFDGTTPFAADFSNVFITQTEAGRILVTVPSGVSLGSIDPGQVLQRASASLSGVSFWATNFMVEHSGPAFNAGDVIRRRAPGSVEVENLLDLEVTRGLPVDARWAFMPGHTLEILTTNGETNTFSILMKQTEDSDFRAPNVE